MPKAAKTAKEIESIKEKILNKALELIIEEGYGKLSMRKIASRLGVTAANIYYYFKNKEEINLMVRRRGFEILQSMLLKAKDRNTSYREKLEDVVRTYVEFGTTYPDYYDIMFNLRTPKVTDYLGTEFAPLATEMKTAGRSTFYLSSELLSAVNKPGGRRDEDIFDRTIQLWSDLHGIISLYNSNLIYQLTEDAEESRKILETRIEKLIKDSLLRKISPKVRPKKV